MTDPRRGWSLESVAAGLGMELEGLDLIQENQYCWILRAWSGGEPLIVKQYKGKDPSLMLTEAAGLEMYRNLVEGDPAWIAAGCLRAAPEHNLIAIEFVPGECFSDLVYRGRRDADARRRSLQVMERLGDFLQRLRRETARPGEALDPWIFEYLEYTSARLQDIPLFGRMLFAHARAEARELIQDLQAASPVPSAVHGDFVFRNMHVDGERAGLIDFANTLSHGHVLHDLYNLYFALQNMALPGSFRMQLWEAFQRGLGELEEPDAAHRFFHEWHRRRWLMLKILGRHPKDWLQAARGAAGFARPWGTRRAG